MISYPYICITNTETMKNKQDMTLADFKYQIKITTKLTKCGQDTKIFLTMEYFGKDHGQIRKDYANREFEYQDKKFVAQTSFIVKDYEDFDIIEKHFAQLNRREYF